MVWYSGSAASWKGRTRPSRTSRYVPRDQRAVTRASGYAASEETASTTATLQTVTSTLLASAPPSAPCCQAWVKLSRVGEVVGSMGEDVSDSGRTARLTRTYTGKPDEQGGGDHRQFEGEGARAVAVHDAALSLRDSTRYCPVDATATMMVRTTASAMLYPNSPSVKASL